LKIITKVAISQVVAIIRFVYRISSVRIRIIHVDRIGHLALNNDLFFRRLKAGYFGKKRFILIGVGKKGGYLIANRTLYRIIKKEATKNIKITFIDSFFIYRLLCISSIKLKEYGINLNLEMNSNEVEFSSYEKVFYFSERDRIAGQRKIEDLGVSQNKDIVCVFARDSAYLSSKDNSKDWSYHDYRDADINTYIPAIKYLVSRGYFVIRIGSTVLERVNYKSKSFIDYPYSNFKSDFMDIFLINISKFVVGTTSGITDVATIFNIPFLGVNYAPFTESPLGRRDRFIPKKMINISGKIVKYINALELGVDDVYLGDDFCKRTGLLYVDNTKEEILEAVIEMESVINGSYAENEKDKILLNKYFSNFGKKNKKAKVKTQPCVFWLRKNIDLYVNKT
jgi:putative glycosyltransferase (TIGR04372 family)